MSHEDHLYHRGIQATPDSNLDLKSQPDVLTDAKRRLGLTVSINQLRACDSCKIRKVKCLNTSPCQACQTAQIECVRTGNNRRLLLAQLELKEAYLPDKQAKQAVSSSEFFVGGDAGPDDRTVELDRAISALTSQVNPMGMNNLVSRDEDMEKPARSEREEADQCDGQDGFISDAVPNHPAHSRESSDNTGKPRLTPRYIHTDGLKQSFAIPAVRDAIRFSQPVVVAKGTENGKISTWSPDRLLAGRTLSSEVPAWRNFSHHVKVASSKSESSYSMPAETSQSNGMTPLRFVRSRTDDFGNAGLNVLQVGLDLRSMRLWGPASYLSLQDYLARLLSVKLSDAGTLDKAFVQLRGEVPKLQGHHLWRWGCQKYVVHGQIDSARLSTAAVGAEPYYLSEALAHRFLSMYETTVQPLFPALDVVAVRGSIDKKFRYNSRGWDVSAIPLRERHQDYPLTTSAFDLDRARDFLVMASGAQIVGGDGDAECHKDLARAWSEIFRRKIRAILYDVSQDQSDIRVINLWIIFAAYNRSYGNSNEELSAAGHASRLAVTMGLDRTAIYGLSIVQTEGYQKTLSMCFHMENFATLCRGIPSSFRRSMDLSESLLGLNDERPPLRLLVDLSDLMGRVQRMFDSLAEEGGGASLQEAIKIYEISLQLDGLANGGPGSLPKSSDRSTVRPDTLIQSDMLVRLAVRGMHCLVRMLSLLPFLQTVVWHSMQTDRVNFEIRYLDLARICTATATEMIDMFKHYLSLNSHLTELAFPSIMLLYSITVIFIHVTTLTRSQASGRYLGAIHAAHDILDHYDHPAARVGQAMCSDLLINHLRI